MYLNTFNFCCQMYALIFLSVHHWIVSSFRFARVYANGITLQCLQPLATSNFSIYLDRSPVPRLHCHFILRFSHYLCVVYCGSFAGYDAYMCTYAHVCACIVCIYNRPIADKHGTKSLSRDDVRVCLPELVGKE